MTDELLTFEEAIGEAESAELARRVLLGNGFSVACFPDVFDYGALLAAAEFSDAAGDIRRIFNLLGTVDFERVIEVLRYAGDLIEEYEPGSELATSMRADAEVVKDALAQVLAANHPDLPFSITENAYRACRTFLANFDRIYTVNYDMLLYWTLMNEIGPEVVRNDGFGTPLDDAAEYVSWRPYDTFSSQRVFYLHGGLHLYDAGIELCKITWSRTNIPLVEQIRTALDEGRFPLIVTEGSSNEKVDRILHHAYLTHAIRSFSSIGGALFAYGVSFSDNDAHVMGRIKEGGIKRLYVSIYGDPASRGAQATMHRALQLSKSRPKTRPLDVRFYDAATAHVWG